MTNAAGAHHRGHALRHTPVAGGSVTNGGTISGGFDAVHFYIGWPALLTIDPGAVFIGTVDGGGEGTINLASAFSAGTLAGLGTQFIDFSQVNVAAGANWTLSNGSTLAAGTTHTNNGALTLAGSFTNAGSIDAIDALQLAAGAYLTNASGGTITGVDAAIDASGNIGTLFNAGTIDLNGTAGSAVELGGSGGVSNAGSASSPPMEPRWPTRAESAGRTITACSLTAGGTVTNQASGTIAGIGTGLGIGGHAGAVVNAGTIIGTSSAGIVLGVGGSVTNAGTIAGANYGVRILGAAGTVENAGTISAAPAALAVSLPGGYANLLVADPGAIFIGRVDGGGGTLEVASGALLSGLGTQFADFTQVDVDVGGTMVISSGISLTALINDGSVDVAGSAVLAVSGSLTGSGSIAIQSGATVSVAGTASAAEAVGFDGASGLLRIGDTSGFASTISGFGTGGTIDLDGLAFASRPPRRSPAASCLSPATV